ncbi:hypothetical protein ACGFWI_25185 [Streptomyces sp. NPDC048434]|uniref:hypothetical protein n=1 Tax=Streptomyces sp. NPDC048434 TaxID=3365549 RepID=UPI00370FF24F
MLSRIPGRAVIAGIAGTAAYTVASTQLKRRGIGGGITTQPGEVATALTGQRDPAGTTGPAHPSAELVNALLHWGYGALGGLSRAALVRRRVSGWQLELAHLGAVWLPWLALLALSGKGQRVNGQVLLVDGGKHLVYVLVAGRTFHLLSPSAAAED